jgi:hypothetical protein
MMGGELCVESEVGQGSCFWFEVMLPVPDVEIEPGEKFPPASLLPSSPAALVPPPEDEMEILLHLALRGDMRGIRERAAHIETLGKQYIPFVCKLSELAKDFEERAILTLVEWYIEENKK